MSGQTTKFPTYLGTFLLFASLCLPALEIGQTAPSIHWIDLGLPIMALCLIVYWSKLQFTKYHALPFLISIYVAFCLLIQAHPTALSDYFEIYKWLKFGVLLLFLSLIDFEMVKRGIPWLFTILVLINLLHFFNLPGVNELLENTYNGGLHLKFFGKNSLGDPAVKRMVGTMGNPNINALLFTFFSIYFLPLQFERKRLFLFLLALTMVFLCQSRTALVVVFVLISYLGIFHSKIWTRLQWLQLIFGIIFSFLMAWMLCTSFFQYSAYSSSLLDGTALYSGSVRGRLETWQLLGQQIVEQPIFGHGPYKNYFYVNRIYSENEYILMAWRYGVFGLLAYLWLYLWPLKHLQQANNKLFIPFILVLLTMLVSALTNNPFTERNIEVLFCFNLAWAFHCHQQRKHEPERA
jgi:O-antigen ligase